jgi:hypothetical protein
MEKLPCRQHRFPVVHFFNTTAEKRDEIKLEIFINYFISNI